MPNLPTLGITVIQADRIMAAFGPDQTSAVDAYKIWLTKTLRAYVMEHTTRKIAEERAAAEALAYQAVMNDLPPEPDPGGGI